MDNKEICENISLKKMCNELNQLNNLLLSYKLTDKEIRTYVRRDLYTEGKQLKKQFKKEFKSIGIDNPLKIEIYILLHKLGIVRNFRTPTKEQIEMKQEIVYSSDEFTSTEEEKEEKQQSDYEEDDENPENYDIDKLNISICP